MNQPCRSLDCARDDGECRSLDCARDDGAAQRAPVIPSEHSESRDPHPTHHGTDQLTNSPTHQLTNSPTHQLTNSPTHQLTNSPTHRFPPAGSAIRYRISFDPRTIPN